MGCNTFYYILFVNSAWFFPSISPDTVATALIVLGSIVAVAIVAVLLVRYYKLWVLHASRRRTQAERRWFHPGGENVCFQRALLFSLLPDQERVHVLAPGATEGRHRDGDVEARRRRDGPVQWTRRRRRGIRQEVLQRHHSVRESRLQNKHLTVASPCLKLFYMLWLVSFVFYEDINS